jgi:molybdate-binding protein/DNA-binding XRE family transcriptional regulator
VSDDESLIKRLRRRRGLSQEALARLAGVGRQAVYDMETGRYLPNTAVALRLARALGCTVEELFGDGDCGCAGDAPGNAAKNRVRDAAASAPGAPGEARQAARPGDRAGSGDAILLLGCDPALPLASNLLSLGAAGIRAHSLFASSRRALFALKTGNAHAALIHYHGDGPHGGNLAAVHSLLPGTDCLVIAFAAQEEGYMVAAGNPLGIRGVEDIASGRARLVNREPGAALRTLLDAQLSRCGAPASAVTGYADIVRSHSEGAVRVASGTADAALGLRLVAESFGLGFVPAAVTRYDLVIPAQLRGHPGITALAELLLSARLRATLGALPGYDVSLTGKTLAVRE